jgi:hypothetical protein
MSEFEELIAILINSFDEDRNSNRKPIILSSFWGRHLLYDLSLLGKGRTNAVGICFASRKQFAFHPQVI